MKNKTHWVVVGQRTGLPYCVMGSYVCRCKESFIVHTTRKYAREYKTRLNSMCKHVPLKVVKL